MGVSQTRLTGGGPSPGPSWSQGFGLTQWRIDANRLMRGSASDGGICETVFLHFVSTIDVPQINHHRASHQISKAFHVERTELFPFGDNHDGVGFLDAVVGPS